MDEDNNLGQQECQEPRECQDKLELIASRVFKPNSEMYKIVDYLNKNLKHKKVMFGLTKSQKDDSMTITIYEI